MERIGRGLKGLLFAVDTVILAESINNSEAKLSIIKEWMAENSMEINSSKCGLGISANGDASQVEISYNGEQILNIDKCVYLGIEFDRHLDLQEMSKYKKVPTKL